MEHPLPCPWLGVADVSAHGPNQPFSQPVSREVFSLAWTESTVYVTVASELREPYDVLYFRFEFASLRVVTGECYMLNY